MHGAAADLVMRGGRRRRDRPALHRRKLGSRYRLRRGRGRLLASRRVARANARSHRPQVTETLGDHPGGIGKRRFSDVVTIRQPFETDTAGTYPGSAKWLKRLWRQKILKHIEGAFRFTHFSANGKEDQFTNEKF